MPITAQPEYIRAALEAGKHVLSEKPIAKDVAAAQELISFYREKVPTGRASWSVAENYRFVDYTEYAVSEVRRLGRILGFRARMNRNVLKDSKYHATYWRNKPDYQGGFILDMGVHFVAMLRLLLGSDEGKIAKVSAFSCQLREHLPPVDTVNATLKLKSGVSGVFEISAGGTFRGGGYAIACEEGTVTILHDSVVTADKDGHETTKTFRMEGIGGVKEEINAWATGMATGDWDQRLSPEEALRDIEVVSRF